MIRSRFGGLHIRVNNAGVLAARWRRQRPPTQPHT